MANPGFDVSFHSVVRASVGGVALVLVEDTWESGEDLPSAANTRRWARSDGELVTTRTTAPVTDLAGALREVALGHVIEQALTDDTAGPALRDTVRQVRLAQIERSVGLTGAQSQLALSIEGRVTSAQQDGTTALFITRSAHDQVSVILG